MNETISPLQHCRGGFLANYRISLLGILSFIEGDFLR